MNKAQIEAHRRQIDDELAEINKELDGVFETKSYNKVDGLSARVDDLTKARSELDRVEKSLASRDEKLAAVMADGGSLAEDDAPQTGFDNGLRLSFTKKMASKLAMKSTNPETKSLASGSSVIVGQEFLPSPILEGRPALSLLDVLPVRPHGTPNFAYLRQTTRTSNAAVWSSGIKPTSTYSVTRIEASLSVIAHMSEPINFYWLADNESLTGFIMSEMIYGLQTAVQSKVLSDIAGTTGIDTQAFSTSIPVSIRKGMSRLEKNGYRPSFIALSVGDFETVEIALSTTNAVEHLGLPFDPAARRLYGVPVVVVPALADGGGYVVASDAVMIDTDSLGIQSKWSDTAVNSGTPNYSDFEANLQRLRIEGRYATSVYQPLGVVAVDTAA